LRHGGRCRCVWHSSRSLSLRVACCALRVACASCTPRPPHSPSLQDACRVLHVACCVLQVCVSRVAGCVSRVACHVSPLHFVGCILRLASCLLHDAVARCVLEHTVTIMVFLCLLFQGRMLNVSCSAKPDGAYCTVRVACDGACCMLRVSCMQRATRSMQQNGMPACCIL
jgi:hypothetical protein